MQFRVNHIEVLFDAEPGHPVLLCHQTRLRLLDHVDGHELSQCTVESMRKDRIPEHGGFQPFAFAMSLIWTQADRLSTGYSLSPLRLRAQAAGLDWPAGTWPGGLQPQRAESNDVDPGGTHDGGRLRGRCRTLKDRTLSAPDSAIARVMAEIENALRLQPSGRRPQQSGAALSGLSVLGRFNSLIVDFISLFVRFISLFGRVGNLYSGVLQYQYLAGTGRVAGPPRIGLFAVFSCRPGNPIPAGDPATSPFSRDRRSSASRGLSSSGRVSRSNARRVGGQRRAGARALLGPDHLVPAGAAPDTPVVGAQRGGEFQRVIAREEMTLDIAAAHQDRARLGLPGDPLESSVEGALPRPCPQTQAGVAIPSRAPHP